MHKLLPLGKKLETLKIFLFYTEKNSIIYKGNIFFFFPEVKLYSILENQIRSFI